MRRAVVILHGIPVSHDFCILKTWDEFEERVLDISR